MHFTSRLLGFRQLKSIVSGRTLVCLLAVLSAPLALYGGTTPSTPPPIETATNNTPPAKTAKRPEKYDIDHIGQRGIGHGFNLYSLKREHELGQSLAASFDRTMRVIHDPVVNDYINSLAQKIVRYSDADIPFTVKVIDSGDVPRAYGLPGGFLYVDSALILSADSEAELAAVMAHEIAHVAARHATRALSRKRVCDVVGSLAMVAGPAGMGVADAGGLAGPLSVKKFSRDAEYEADLLGIEYAYAAGYDPQALLDALEKLHAIEVQRNAELAKVPGYHLASKVPFHSSIAKGFANYPLTEERIGRLQAEIATFLPDRKDYVIDTNEFQEIKARLLASQTPVLHHHAGGSDDDSNGPVLRRVPEVEETSDTRTVQNFAFVK
ncbi:MAG: M48 family metalloprotease [Candidatus Sulfotelmatobacter sp.]